MFLISVYNTCVYNICHIHFNIAKLKCILIQRKVIIEYRIANAIKIQVYILL